MWHSPARTGALAAAAEVPLPWRREVKKIAKARPTEYNLPFSTRNLAELAGLPWSQGMVGDQAKANNVEAAYSSTNSS